MRLGSMWLGLAAVALSGPALADALTPAEASQNVNKASALILNEQPAQALALAERVLADYDKPLADARAKGQAYCATNTTEALLYGARAANRKASSTIFPNTLCAALFIKAYAFNELKRETDGVAALEELTALAPLHAQYFIELGYGYRVTGAPDKAMVAYRTAFDTSGTPGLENARAERAAALRGIGYLLIDKHDLDGAADSYRKSLEEDPGSAIARSELDYIDGLRKQSR